MAVRKLTKPWVVKKGVNNRFTIRLTNTDITDFQFRTDLKYKAGDSSPIVTLTNGNGFTILNGPSGLLEINFSKAILDSVVIPTSDTEFPFVIVYFDIEFNDGTNSPPDWEALVMGPMRVHLEITGSN